MNSELEKLHQENESLRKEANACPTLKSVVSEIDDCLTILMREIMNTNINMVDEDLRNEIHDICSKIIDTIPKPPLTLEVDGEEDGVPNLLERDKNGSTDSLSSGESFDEISSNSDEVER